MKNNSYDISFMAINVSEYVQGAAPDRWHWCKNCKQYPRVIIKRRSMRPTSDLCDQCSKLEKLQECPA
jgi:hypothetical protein